MTDILCFYIAFVLIAIVVTIFNCKLGYLFFLLGSLLSVIDFLSMQMLNTHITLLVLTGFDWTMIKMAPKVVPKYFWGTVLIIIIHFLLPLYLHKKLKANIYYIKNKKIAVFLLIIICVALGCLSLKSGTAIAYKDIVVHSYNIHKYRNISVDELFHLLGSKKKYLYNSQITASPGKNLVVIYCESLDANFLNSKQFPLETVRLNKLKKNGMYFYDNYKCVLGSGWTIAALYSTQTGLPCLFGASKGGMGGNSALINVHTIDAVSFTDVLSKAGYKNVFLANSSLKFAGTGNLMTLFGYECKGWNTFGKKVARTKWGVHDYDLFEAAKREFKKLNENNQPFNLTLLTIDTHYPKGVPDKRLRSKINKKIPSKSHEYTIASLDYLLDDFIRFIKENENGKDTVIVILGDHLMIGNENVTPIVKKLKKKSRRVLLMSNKKSEHFKLHDEIGFYDIPHIILELVNVETDALFLKDLGINITPEFIKNKQDIFTILNMKLCN